VLAADAADGEAGAENPPPQTAAASLLTWLTSIGLSDNLFQENRWWLPACLLKLSSGGVLLDSAFLFLPFPLSFNTRQACAREWTSVDPSLWWILMSFDFSISLLSFQQRLRLIAWCRLLSKSNAPLDIATASTHLPTIRWLPGVHARGCSPVHPQEPLTPP
jgi:hypothetical protein